MKVSSVLFSAALSLVASVALSTSCYAQISFGGSLESSLCTPNTDTSINISQVQSVKMLRSGQKIKYVIAGSSCSEMVEVSGTVDNELDRDCLEMAKDAKISGTLVLNARKFKASAGTQSFGGSFGFSFGSSLPKKAYSAGLITACELK